MPRHVIPVRNRHSGETATVSEAAFRHFAADYERLDQTAPEPAATAGPADSPADPTTPTVRRAAPKTSKE